MVIVAGWVLGRLGVERWIEPFVLRSQTARPNLLGSDAGGLAVETKASAQLRVRIGLGEVRDILGEAWPYLLIGVGLGAVIHGRVPAADEVATLLAAAR